VRAHHLIIALLALTGCAPSAPPPEEALPPPPPPPPPGPNYYFCQHVRAPLEIDGRIKEAGWERAQWAELFVDIEGPDEPEPRLGTSIKMMWDQQYFYVGAVMEEPHLRASLTEHDSVIYHDNDFEVFIDPDGNTRDYYEIEINILETVFDLFLPKTYADGGIANHDWNCEGLKTAVQFQGTLNDPSDIDLGWSVEMAIPWAALAPNANVQTPPLPGHVWRMNFSRVQWQFAVVDGEYQNLPDTPEDNWVWSPQGVIDMHKPEKWGYVEFIRQW
jgi:hypothetical protein